MRTHGAAPLSDLRHYLIRPHVRPERAAERGEFYIRDGWIQPSLHEGHVGTDVVYLVDFMHGDDDRSARFSLGWSPLREKIVELVLRGGSPVGPCRLVSKPLYEAVSLWVIVGVEDDGTIYDPLSAFPETEQHGDVSTI